MKTGRVSIEGVDLHWRESGGGEAVVLLHAFPLHSGMWEPQLSSLPADRHWIAPDLRGFGRSACGGEPASMELYADDVAALLDHLGHERATVCGVSMGGYVAFAFWRHHPQRIASLVLCDTRAGADDPEGRAARRLSSERVRAEGPDAAVAQLLDRLVGETTRRERPEVYDRVRSLIAEVDPVAFAGAQTAMANRPDSSIVIGEIHVPALVVVGDEDAIVTVADGRGLAESLPNGRLEVIEGAGHLPNLERPEAFDAALTRFLAL